MMMMQSFSIQYFSALVFYNFQQQQQQQQQQFPISLPPPYSPNYSGGGGVGGISSMLQAMIQSGQITFEQVQVMSAIASNNINSGAGIYLQKY